MIIMHIMGGIGNQFFQYAFGRYLAYKHNTELKLDITECENSKTLHHNYYRLGEFNVHENFATLEEIKSLARFEEQAEIINVPDNSFLIGHFANEKYFFEIRDILLREMTLKNPLGKNSSKWKEKILSADCSVSLHVRNGDYLVPHNRTGSQGKRISLEYYIDSLKELQKDFPNLTVFVFSDDLQWCKENLKFDVPTEFVEGCETDAEELYLMSICNHNIISNSTFSWWGAWLNKNPKKKVFIPEFYITMQNSVSIPIKENARPLVEFPPMLSVIVYVENNLPTVNLSLSSILSQDFPDYEIILVDASTDGSGDFCRQITPNKKVTLLTANNSTDKFSAWNKALEVARGDYVLFLTAKEFLFPNVAKSLAQFYYSYLKRYVEPRGEYISFANYGEIYPDIICMTQFIEEDEKGTVVINNIQNKKFSLKVSSTLKNLNTFVEVYIPFNQKLTTLATQEVNNFVGTKFFKRKFINDNNIRFIGGGRSVNSELAFIVDTFMRTEKIVFMPQVFLGRLK